MTPDQLDEARAFEAVKRTYSEVDHAPSWSGYTTKEKTALIHAARLAREGWLPVDPDLSAARGVLARLYPEAATNIRNGEWGGGSCAKLALTAIKRGRELAGGS